jgi:hypothetical protein
LTIDDDDAHHQPSVPGRSSTLSGFDANEDHTATQSSIPAMKATHRVGMIFDSPICDFSSFSEYFNTLEHQDGIVVVLYAASFCKLCQRATVVYKQIASKRKPVDPRLTFYRIEVTPNDGRFMRPLHIQRFPYIQIFFQRNCVASFSTGPAHQFRKKVEDTLDVCSKRTAEDWIVVQEEFREEIQENRRVRSDLMQRLLRP